MTREEAIETIRRCCPKVGDSQCYFESALRELIPELRESEDERIRKALIDGVRQIRCKNGITQEQMIAYLEKQKEQKPAEWSKNDTVFLNEITDFFENKTVRLQHDLDMYAHWLKSLPERFNLQPKQEWSKEDEMYLSQAIDTLEFENYFILAEKLKSIRSHYYRDITMTEAYKMGKEAAEAAIKYALENLL